MKELIDNISNIYEEIRVFVKGDEIKNDISEILVSKVLLGTLGCVPAYDRFFIDGLRRTNVASGKLSIKSIMQLACFYKENDFFLEPERQKMHFNNILYPQMKFLDMGFWQIGADAEKIDKI